ncbi:MULTISPECIES: substrate-binding domain-containing protein [unclassified Mesorhizobium]|uniref:substrate-binding domain-containing protein n=1 Tax=unclassified Mesorhizobium TaxID=325217 RepID=UPI000FD6F06A|nr:MULTISPECIES: substrate-binding domain-containing protein [unclassified Mesorhizobium]TGQ11492.1 ribose ABC transporter substrate-binding protein [Mesorhizobium sp. M2E.F.Ca.ET.219.01.1.1]TGT64322.1 ribose ABC transporter substrate-binding protein [Mesorhizobium sp. M2E.F.Ca.ET.166.01.1.1]TGV97253.1 ribose ABC transporter substrate-binding protein [Mesorhizobium sp. M2E.F.Ca.ET.154.01.1.1]
MTNRRHFLRTTALAATLLAGGMLSGAAFAEEKIKIGFSQGTMNHPWRVAMVEGNKKYAAEHYPDVDLIITDGNNDASKQVADVENLIAQGIKVLMISPLTEQALTPVVKDAMDAGIKVVTLDRKVNTPVTVHVGGENLPLGVGAGEFLAKKLNGKGNIIELQGTAGASATIDRNKGFAEAIAKFPDMKVVASQNCDYTRDKAVKFMEDMVQRFGPGQIQAVYAHNDEMALGAIQVLEAAGRLNEVAVVGIDGQETAFEAVKQGKLAATFVYPFVAPEGIETAYKVAKGEQVPPTITLPTVSVTADNIAQMIGKGF